MYSLKSQDKHVMVRTCSCVSIQYNAISCVDGI